MERIRDIVEKAKETARLQEDKYKAKIRNLNQQIDALQKERNKAETTKREFALISKLSEKGAKEAWEQLSERRKYEKEILLAVFASQDIPPALYEQNWYTNAPEELKDDREILIARASATTFPVGDDRWMPTPCFSIPEPLLGDLEVLRAVAKPCPRALQLPGIPTILFDDDALFQAFVDRKPAQYCTHKIGLDTILERFSCRIRSKAEFMLQAAKMGINVFPYIAGGLRNDKGFCLMLTKVSVFDVPNDALTYLSDTLKADREVVLSLIQRNGCVLKDAAPSHRQDLEIVYAAADSRADALVHCTGLVRERLSRDKEYMKSVLKKRGVWSEYCPGLYAMLDKDLKLDLDLIVTAREGNCLGVADLPDQLSQDPQFWKDVLEETSLFWNDLPDRFKLDISFARCITGFRDIDIVKEVVKVHPDLSADAEFWRGAILSCTSYYDDDEDIVDLIREIGSEVRNNRALMLLACSKTEHLLQELPRDFMLDREFVAATVENSDYAVPFLPFEAQLLYPDLVVLAITEFCDELEECVEYVNPELWSNLDVAEAWFSEHGPIPDEIPDRLKEDPGYCMLVVEHCPYHEAEQFVSHSLKASKDFILRAVKTNPLAYQLAEGDLEMDYDVTLAGFGAVDSDELVDAMIDMQNDRAFAYFHSFLQEVQRKLQLHESLLSLLFGMSSFSGSGCQLSKLQRGQETTLILKQRIADYLGCPVGDELAQLRRAAEALQRMPHPDDNWMDVDFLPMGMRMFFDMAQMAMQD